MIERAAAQAAGLSEAEAQARLEAEGYNELPRPDRRTPLRIVLEVLREPMIALLLAGCAVYFALGDWREAVILLVFASLSVLITAVQETRTERVLEALRDLTSPRALVIRGGERKRIPGREVARGDLTVLSEGDRVPADAALIEAQDLLVDESLLTGESAPVRKAVKASERNSDSRPGGDDSPFVFSGSLIVRGAGLAEVTATGAKSEIGKIGQSLTSLDPEPLRLRGQLNRLVRVFGTVGAGVTILAVALYGTMRGHWLDALLGGIALGMSMLPEEFPVVLAVFMAMGAWRISRARVLTRRAAAIETLGSATVLCTDRTGTLTVNRMTIVDLRLADGDALRLDRAPRAALPDAFRDLVHVGALACAREPFDPMEKAFHALDRMSAARALVEEDLDLVRVYGLRPDLLAVTQAWRPAEGSPLVLASKGAPEAIAELCRFDGERVASLKRLVSDMAANGLRILGVALANRRERRTAGLAARGAFRIPWTGRSCRSLAAGRGGGGPGVPVGGNPGRDDHRRLSRDRGGDRPGSGAGREPCHDRQGARGHRRRQTEGDVGEATCSPASCPTRSSGSSTS